MRVRVAVLALIATSFGCRSSGAKGAGLGTPEATFETLQVAVANRDLDLYESCFTDAANDRGESMLERLKSAPDVWWAQLAGVLRAPQSIKNIKIEDATALLEIEAPQADKGGIKEMDMRLIKGEWKIHRW